MVYILSWDTALPLPWQLTLFVVMLTCEFTEVIGHIKPSVVGATELHVNELDRSCRRAEHMCRHRHRLSWWRFDGHLQHNDAIYVDLSGQVDSTRSICCTSQKNNATEFRHFGRNVWILFQCGLVSATVRSRAFWSNNWVKLHLGISEVVEYEHVQCMINQPLIYKMP